MPEPDEAAAALHPPREGAGAGLVDSGVRYCLTHHGIQEQDASICDFAKEAAWENEQDDCATTPLLYRKEAENG